LALKVSQISKCGLNENKLVDIENLGVGRNNEDLHIPQPKKGINVLNIIIQNILEKIGCGKNGPQRNT
jgi:hypothetical protein